MSAIRGHVLRKRTGPRGARIIQIKWEIWLSAQFGMTLAAALGIGLWQMRSIKRSRDKRGEHGHVGHPPPIGDPDSDETAPRRPVRLG